MSLGRQVRYKGLRRFTCTWVWILYDLHLGARVVSARPSRSQGRGLGDLCPKPSDRVYTSMQTSTRVSKGELALFALAPEMSDNMGVLSQNWMLYGF